MRLSKAIASIVVVAAVFSGVFFSSQASADTNNNATVANHSISSAYTALVQKQIQPLK